MKKLRGFEIAKGWENAGISLPQRATKNSAGYDLAAATNLIIAPISQNAKPFLIPTGLKVYCPPDEYLLIANRSSNPKRGLVLANGFGIIDADYYNNPTNDGHFQISVFNITNQPIQIKKGERIAQALFQKYLLADNDSTNSDRQGGIGSTN